MNFSIIGGDLRTVKLAQMLSKEHQIYTYGIENEEKNIFRCSNLEETLRESNIIIGPVPLTKDGENINAPFVSENIKIEEIIEKLTANKVFIAGAIKKDICEKLENKNVKTIDLMEQEELTVLNTISTAEGAIQIAIEKTERNIQETNVLILGFGRVGKVVAKKFKALDAYITCAARKKEDLAWIKTLGYKAINIAEIGENLKKYNIIINTIPKIILTKKELRYINNQAIIIDLASKPGGIEQKSAEELGIQYVWALALPGKVSPVTSAEFIKETIYNIL